MKRYLLSVLITALIPLLAAGAENKTAKEPFPFNGEAMKFAVGWEFVTAGTATMQFSKEDDNSYRIDTDARTNSFFDMFKKVRDTIISQGIYVAGRPQSTRFDVEQHERGYHAVKKTEFLWKEKKVNYTHNDKKETFNVPAGHLNVMDAFYLTRTLPVIEGKVLKIPVFDSRKRYKIEVKLLKKEMMGTPWGEVVECLVIEPKLKSEGIFSSVGTMQIWITNDDKRIPLKMTAKIKIGRIIARLISYKAPETK